MKKFVFGIDKKSVTVFSPSPSADCVNAFAVSIPLMVCTLGRATQKPLEYPRSFRLTIEFESAHFYLVSGVTASDSSSSLWLIA